MSFSCNLFVCCCGAVSKYTLKTGTYRVFS